MDANIITKSSGGTNLVDGNVINLASPSIVELKIAPESVASFERVGNDLKMVLLDGQEVLIQNFFVKSEEGERSDLVLVDEQGVMWWGQYPEEWSQFHFTEIENHFAAFPPWLPGALGLLGVAAVAAGGGGGGGSSPAPNRAPTAVDDEGYGLMGEPVTGNVLENDTDADGDPLRVTEFGIGGNTYKPGETAKVPGVGELTVNEDGSYTFTPEPGFHGQVPPIEYTVEDGNGGSDKGNLDIVVNAPPVTEDDQVTVNPDGSVDAPNVLDNDGDPDGDHLVVTEFSFGEQGPVPAGQPITIEGVGTLTISPDGTVNFSPEPGYIGPIPPAEYTVSDGKGGNATGTVNFENGANTPPAPGDDVITVRPDGSVDAPNVLDNDGDIDGDDLVVTEFSFGGQGPVPAGSAIDIPGVGELTIEPDGSVTFTPDPGYTGPIPDAEYTVSDGQNDSTGKVTFTNNTNTPPIADDDVITVKPNGDVDAPNVLANDGDPDGDALIVTEFSFGEQGPVPAGSAIDIPGVGELTIDPDGTVSFTPEPDYTGPIPDAEYTVSDGKGGESTGTVTFVNNNGADELAAADDHVTVLPDGSVDAPNVLANDGNPGGDTLTVTGFSFGEQGPVPAGSAIDIPGVGKLTIDSDGTVSFTPEPGYTGPIPDAEYTVSDGAETTMAVVTFTNNTNTPPLASDDVITVKPDGSVDAPNVLANDDDPDGPHDDLTVTEFSFGDQGPVPAGSSIDIPGIGELQIDPNGDVTFTPAGGYEGDIPDASYTISDGLGSDTATIRITNNKVNQPPVAADDTATTLEDTPLTGNVITDSTEGHQPDTDPDGDSLAVTEFEVGGTTYPVSEGTPGSATIVGVGIIEISADGSYTFTPETDWNGSVPPITYTISDGEGGSDTAELKITVEAVNDAPEGTDKTFENVVSGSSTTLTADDFGFSDPSDSPANDFKEVIVQPPSAGQLLLDGVPITNQTTVSVTDINAGKLVYEAPIGDAESQPTITFQVVDDGGTDSGGQDTDQTPNTLTFDVAANQPPEGSGDRYDGIIEASEYTSPSSVLGNDTDADTPVAELTVAQFATDGDGTGAQTANGSNTVTTALGGTVTMNDDGTFVYTAPVLDHDASDTPIEDSFYYQANDGTANSGWTKVTLGVTDTEPAVDAPENAEVSEANLPAGSDPDAPSLQATGSLGVVPGADSFDAQFTADTVAQLEERGLTSGGTPLTYELSSDDHTLVARAGDATIFTLEVTNPTANDAGYSFTLQGPLDHGEADELDLPISFTVTDSDGDSAPGSFSVKVLDDTPPTDVQQSVAEDGSVSFNTSADATPGNTMIHQGGSVLTGVDNSAGGKDYETAHGTVTVNADGSITYTPDANYSGRDDFEYHTNNAGDETTTTVEMTVNPVADAPELRVDADTVITPEDTAVALGFKAPAVTDGVDQNGTEPGDNPERLGLITLTGIPDGAVLQFIDEPPIASDGGPIVIRLVDGESEIASAGPAHLTITTAEFEAMKVLPPPNSHANFTVTMSVTSYEVDDAGAPLAGVPGAAATAEVLVDVHAVTDEPGLTLEQPGDPADVGAVDLTTTAASGGDSARISVAVNEDQTLDLTSVLQEAFVDTDGSESLWYEITGLPEGTQVVVNGQTYSAGSDGKVDTSGDKISITAAGQNPEFKITPPENYSNDQAVEARIRLNVQDSDSDSVDANPQVEHVDVDLSLRVYAVPDDVTLADPDAIDEDTASAFLAKLGLTDTDGSETITQVRIADLPDEGGAWKLLDHAGNDVTSQVTGAGLTLVVGTGTGEYTLDQIKAFTLQPPAHSSLDGKATVYVTTQEDGANTETGNALSQEWEHQVTVPVHPVAEEIGAVPGDGDSDGDGTADLTMTADHHYATAGAEDTWFDLNIDADFELADGWNNQDASEQTFARLTPELVAGDGGLANAIGSQFQWIEGGVTKTATYGGVPIDVPVGSLGSLQFKAAPNFSGQFNIKVQAHTVDADEDGDGPVSEATSGEAWLTNILIEPVADDVTLAINGRASGLEDSAIPLSIRPTSSDPSESFNITIADIPVGSTVTYGSQTFTATSGNTSWTISDFSSAEPLTIQPPENSNADFTLKVLSESVDTLTIGGNTYTDTKAGPSLDLNVSVKGVADAATVTPKTAPDYTEADLDSATPSKPVQLSDLASVALTDTDGSETLTLRISGLPEGFAPSAGTLLDPTATGADRVWVLSQSQFESATIEAPANYSGTVEFQLTPVTTENDGDSLTGSATDLSFTVTPSPEATTTTSAELVEDVLGNIGLAIVHQDGDVDEVLTGVRIATDQLAGKDFTLFLGDDAASAKTLAQALTDGDITEDSGYYVLTGEQAAQLSAQGGANLDGDLGSFNFQYQITDSHYGADDSGASTTSSWQDASFALVATPVTDAPQASITAIGLAANNGSTVDDVSGDDASPDTVTLTAGDTVTVTLNVASPDADGSEHVVRVVIDGVPEGVTVTGGEYLGGNQWLLVYSGGDALPINTSGGVDLPVQFVVSGYAGGITDQAVTLTAQVQDRGNTGSAATIESDSVTWHLNTTYAVGTGAEPAEITTWAYSDQHAREDGPSTLADLFNAVVEVTTTDAPNTFTVTLRDLPVGTEVTGMVHTVVGGHDVWTASTIVTGDTAAAQAALDALLEGIKVTPPENGNENNAPDAFTFDATLTTSVTGGNDNAQTVMPTVPVDPVTDEAQFIVAVDDADGRLDETDASVALSLTVSNDADGSHGTIVDGRLYLQLSGDNVTAGGTLTVGGNSVALHAVTGVTGLSDGDYYVVEGVAMGDTLALEYTPEGAMSAGTITVDSWVQNSEPDGGTVLSHDHAVLPVEVANNGVTISSTATSGSEAANSDKASAIELAGLQVALNDTDGSEAINAILLQGLPEGFLVYVGTDAASATLAHNAGGTSGLNTWVLSEGGDLPAYVAILPPQYWSGTLSDLTLAVESGETSLSDTRFDTQVLAPITIAPVADGIALDATLAFGRENAIIALNLNSTMHDSAAIDNAIPDGSTETVTLQLTGMGEHASFYVGSQEITSGISYDGGSNTYTLTGLSQEDVDALGFRQLASALTDQDTGTAGLQIGVTAWTVESGAPDVPSASDTTTITLNVSNQLATTGADSLLWTGEAINGLGGVDSVALRAGEDVSGSDLAAFLTNVEQIDLSVGGANEILGLTPEDVWSILGPNNSSSNTLTFLGNGDDTVSLGSGWTSGSGADEGTWSATVGSGSNAVDVIIQVANPLGNDDDWPTVTSMI